MIANRSMPQATVIPVLAYPDLNAAIVWLCAAFGFTVRLRIGDHRAQLNVGDGAIVLTAHPESGAGTPAQSSVMIRVNDARAHHARASEHGARIVQTPTDFPYGERQYSAVDPFGRSWGFSQSIADVDPAAWGGVTGES